MTADSGSMGINPFDSRDSQSGFSFLASNPQNLRDIFHSVYNPCVVVVTTPEVDCLLQKYCGHGILPNQALCDMLNESGHLCMKENLLIGGHNISCDFRVKFVTLASFCGQGQEVPLTALDNPPINYACKMPLKTLSDLTQFNQQCLGNAAPWYSVYFRTFLEKCCGASFHETLSHPFAWVLVGSVNEPNLINSLSELLPSNTPELFQLCGINPIIPRYYFLLDEDHQDQDRGADNNSNGNNHEEILKSFGSIFGASSYSVTSVDSNFSNREMLLEEFCRKFFILELQKLIEYLETHVASSRKGMTNKMRSIWNRFGGSSGKKLGEDFNTTPTDIPSSPTPSSPLSSGRKGITVPPDLGKSSSGLGSTNVKLVSNENNNQTYFGFQSVQYCTRRLADLLFLLGHDGLALPYYKQAASDFKAENARIYHAGVQEMLGLVSFLQGRPREQIYLEKAIAEYELVGNHIFFQRAMMFLTHILMSKQRYSSAVDVFVRGASSVTTNPAVCGMFYEQAALIQTLSSPRKLRQLCYYMIRAGDLYFSSGFVTHSYRCVKLTHFVYTSIDWPLLQDQLRVKLVHLAAHLGLLQEALTYASLLVSKNCQNAMVQSSNFRQYLFLFRGISKKMNQVLSVPVPLIDESSMELNLEDDPPNTSIWKDTVQMTIMEERVVVVGEILRMTVKVTNPLLIPLFFSCAHLSTQWKSNISDDMYDEPETADINTSYSNCAVQVLPFDVTLAPLKEKTLEFRVIPRKSGFLTIKGLRFQIDDGLWGQMNFSPHVPEVVFVEDTSTSRNLVSTDHGHVVISDKLKIRIVPSHAQLSLDLVDFPQQFLDGEVVKIYVQIKNASSNASSTNMRVAFHPSNCFSFWFKSNNDNESNLVAYNDNSGEKMEAQNGNHIELPSGFSKWHPLDASNLDNSGSGFFVNVLGGLENQKGISRQHFRIILMYDCDCSCEDSGSQCVLSSRFAYAHASSFISPSLTILSKIYPSQYSIDTSLLHLEIENRHNIYSIAPDRISVCNTEYLLEPMDENINWTRNEIETKGWSTLRRSSQSEFQSIIPRGKVSLFFKLTFLKSTVSVDNDEDSPECMSSAHSHFVNEFIRSRLKKEKSDRERNIASSRKLDHFSRLEDLEVNGRRLSLRTRVMNSEYCPPESFQEKANIVIYWKTGTATDLVHQSSSPLVVSEGHHLVCTLFGTNTLFVGRPEPFRTSSISVKEQSSSVGYNVTGAAPILKLGERKLSIPVFRHISQDISVSPVRIRLVYDPIISHDFKIQRICYVPVQVQVLNNLMKHEICYSLEFLMASEFYTEFLPYLRHSEVAQFTQQQQNIPNEFFWSGVTSYPVYGIPPRGLRKFNLFACFQVPGVYCLNTFRLSHIARRLYNHSGTDPSSNTKNDLMKDQTLNSDIPKPPPPPP